MRIEHYLSETLKIEILQIFRRYLDLTNYKIFFFGSRVNGKGNERSDIDVGIIGPDKISASTFFKVEEEISELPVLYKIDLVDFKTVPEEFKEIALKNVEYLN